MSTDLCDATHALVLGFEGGSNIWGPTRTAPWPRSKPANVEYHTTHSGSLVLADDWNDDYGLATPLCDYLVHELGYTDPIVVVEHGVAGATIEACANTYAAELVAHFATVGVRPAAVVCYVGSADAGSGALAAAARANIQTVGQRFRTAWGAGVGLILGGLHTPVGGATADMDTVDAALLDYASDHRSRTAAYFANREAAIQGGASSHLSDGLGGGCHTTAIKAALLLHAAGVLR